LSARNPPSPGSPLRALGVYAFADFSSNSVQDLLDRFDWPGKPVDADRRRARREAVSTHAASGP